MPEIAQLIAAYESGIESLSRTVAETDPDHWDQRVVEGQWTIRELVCHLADAEIVYADRMKRVLAEDNPRFSELVPDQFTTLSNQRNVVAEVSLMEAIRCQVGTILKHCDVEDFLRTGVHSLEGPMTLETLLERIVAHVPHHENILRKKITRINGGGV